jgi:DNA-binding response OmpR family regulator
MPEMDGYETMHETAKPQNSALFDLRAHGEVDEGEREEVPQCRCGDYIAKPVNTDQLLSLMRVWLPINESQDNGHPYEHRHHPNVDRRPGARPGNPGSSLCRDDR